MRKYTQQEVLRIFGLVNSIFSIINNDDAEEVEKFWFAGLDILKYIEANKEDGGIENATK